jgi:hypothetical protein
LSEVDRGLLGFYGRRRLRGDSAFWRSLTLICTSFYLVGLALVLYLGFWARLYCGLTRLLRRVTFVFCAYMLAL